MPEVRNLAAKYATKVDERFTRESQAMIALNSDYKFTGVRTVNVYSIPTVPMTDYKRSGTSRYGTPEDLTRTIQTMTIKNDRGFTFIIDKGDKTQSQMVMDSGKALNRQLKEVWVPEFDAYAFSTIAAAAVERGNYSDTPITLDNAYSEFLEAMESLGNKNVPEAGRVALCSYKFANYLKQDPAFIKTGDSSQDMLIKGVIGEVDGCKIVKVPSSRLPAGCAFIITHNSAAVGCKQLEEYKTHADPPGISGLLVEGRAIYDCFVLNEKANAIFYHGGISALKTLNVIVSVAENDAGVEIAKVMVNPGAEKGATLKFKLGTVPAVVTADTDVSGWDAMTKNVGTSAAGDFTVATVAEVKDGKVVSVGSYKFK